MNEVRWGILGCGDVIERKVAWPLAHVAGSRIEAVARRSADKAEDFARRHGVPFWTTRAEALIGRSDVDAVYVATPPEHHLEHALLACDAGKPCVVEKPAGRSDEECEAMVEHFRAAGVPLYVSYYRRHLPRFRRVREILRSGCLGPLVSISYRMSKPLRLEGRDDDARRFGGGRFYDLSGHVLDLLDDWFGPVEVTGSAAVNSVPAHATEDAVVITFRTAGGAIGSATWNFAASHSEDEFVIEGPHGRLRFKGTSVDAPVICETSAAGALRASSSILERNRALLRRSLALPFRRTWRFPRCPYPHQPMLERIVTELREGTFDSHSAASALRTSRVMNRSLDAYYSGRRGPFWERPSTWKSIHARAVRRLAKPAPEYALSPGQIRTYHELGFVGPFDCEAPWREVRVPVKKGRNLHLTERTVFEICTHPCIVKRAAELLGGPDIALYKSRFIVKEPGSRKAIGWHQDIGAANGGFHPDGRPVETLGVWLALAGVDRENGALEVIPGSHRRVLGVFDQPIRERLVANGTVTAADLARAVHLELKPGQFILFHAWLLHSSGINRSKRRRAGLNIRFAREAEAHQAGVRYFPLGPMTGTDPQADAVRRAPTLQAAAKRRRTSAKGD
jgi:predicted dehydrogenase